MTVDDIQRDLSRKSLRGEWIDGKYITSTWEMWHVLSGRKPKGELTSELAREWSEKSFEYAQASSEWVRCSTVTCAGGRHCACCKPHCACGCKRMCNVWLVRIRELYREEHPPLTERNSHG